MITQGTEVDPRTLNAQSVQNSRVPQAPVMDLAESIKGFYRLLDLTGDPFDMYRSYPRTKLLFL